jgi:hypothetical protein
LYVAEAMRIRVPRLVMQFGAGRRRWEDNAMVFSLGER